MNIYEMTLNEYLDAAASKSSTPGGGSVSAVVAANAAAMVSMVANLTLGKKGYEQVQDDAREICDAAGKIISDMKILTEKDIQAFQNFMDVWRLPSASDEDKSKKKALMEKAAQTASLVPLDICKACMDILTLAFRLAPTGNKSAISDVGVGAYLAEAALKSAALSIDINLPLISDTTFKLQIEAWKAALLMEAEKLAAQTLAQVRKRL